MGQARTEGEAWTDRMPIWADRPLRACVAVAVILGTAFALRMALRSAIPVGSPFVTFFPAVILISFLFGARWGAIAAIASALTGAAFFMSDPMAPGYFVTAMPSVFAFAVLASLNLLLFHWMQRANAQLRVERARSAALAETRQILFSELQHRVSNNLQVAAGLLSLQKHHVAGADAQAALDEASRRIAVIGGISRELYQPDGGARGVCAMLAPLCADVVDAAGQPGVQLEVTGDTTLALKPDAALPVALIVAEAVANAIEHGLAGRDGGSITVHCGRGADGGLCIEIRDDGRGLPAGFDIEKGGSLGLRIARMLAGQLGGRFELVSGNGTTARLILPA